MQKYLFLLHIMAAKNTLLDCQTYRYEKIYLRVYNKINELLSINNLVLFYKQYFIIFSGFK